MNSKIYLFVGFCILQSIYSNAFLMLNFGTECIPLLKLVKATKILCDNRNNGTLWQEVINCHAPITEKFLRESAEAQCPIPKKVEDPTDTDISIQEVFFNICSLIEGNLWDKVKGVTCLFFGNEKVMSHYKEVEAIKKTWGKQVPCNIGKCVLRMGLNL